MARKNQNQETNVETTPEAETGTTPEAGTDTDTPQAIDVAALAADFQAFANASIADGKGAEQVRKRINDDAGVVMFHWPHTDEVVTVAIADIPEKLHSRLALHGLSQKIGDAYAKSKGTELSAKRELADTIVDQLLAGDWSTARGSGDGAQPSMVMQAVIDVLTAAEKEFDAAKVKDMASTPQGRKNILANPAFAARYEELKLERQRERAEAAKAKAAEAAQAASAETAEGEEKPVAAEDAGAAMFA